MALYLARDQANSLIFTSDFFQSDGSAVVSIELAEGLLNKLDSEWGHWASDRSQELVVIDVAVLIVVKHVEESLDVFLAIIQSEIVAGLGEFRQVQ